MYLVLLKCLDAEPEVLNTLFLDLVHRAFEGEVEYLSKCLSLFNPEMWQGKLDLERACKKATSALPAGVALDVEKQARVGYEEHVLEEEDEPLVETRITQKVPSIEASFHKGEKVRYLKSQAHALRGGRT